MISAIFEKQEELMRKYKEIENLPDWPLDLDKREHQVILKDFKWRFVEEVVESYAAEEYEPCIKELADGLHFITELLILAGLKAENVGPTPGYYVLTATEVICMVARASNMLKNRPWTRQDRKTDQGAYKSALLAAWACYFEFMKQTCGSEEAVLQAYLGEHKKNKDRIAGGY